MREAALGSGGRGQLFRQDVWGEVLFYELLCFRLAAARAPLSFTQPPRCVEPGITWICVGGILSSPGEEERAELRWLEVLRELDVQLKPPLAVGHPGICSLPE